jgi:hypothetical protein
MRSDVLINSTSQIHPIQGFSTSIPIIRELKFDAHEIRNLVVPSMPAFEPVPEVSVGSVVATDVGVPTLDVRKLEPVELQVQTTLSEEEVAELVNHYGLPRSVIESGDYER